MTDDALVIKGREKRIFLRALRAYSDNCAPPSLTPECPFYELTEQGPSCADECRDILARHGDNSGKPEGLVLDLGDGYEAYRTVHRPRRPPDPTERPFDVAVIRRGDEERPRDQRRTTSLVDELREFVIVPPWMHPDSDERSYIIRACREELESRGLDVEAMIRYAIAPLFAYMIGIQHKISSIEDLRPDPEWIRLLEESFGREGTADEDRLASHAFSGAFGTQVRWWAATAPLDHIEHWVAPTKLPDPAADPDSERLRTADWMIDRFTLTYIADWKTDSLLCEWQYLLAKREGPCMSHSMAERRVHADQLARIIAERISAERVQQTGRPERSPVTADDFTVVAVENIEAGRIEVAISIFEGYVRFDPGNASANNNYGFCLLPTDPERGYEYLARAEQLGYHSPATNAADRVLALHLLGRDCEALELADATLNAGYPRTPAYRMGTSPGRQPTLRPTFRRSHLPCESASTAVRLARRERRIAPTPISC